MKSNFEHSNQHHTSQEQNLRDARQQQADLDKTEWQDYLEQATDSYFESEDRWASLDRAQAEKQDTRRSGFVFLGWRW